MYLKHLITQHTSRQLYSATTTKMTETTKCN